jgi:hypothetical protein
MVRSGNQLRVGLAHHAQATIRNRLWQHTPVHSSNDAYAVSLDTLDSERALKVLGTTVPTR